MNIYAIIAHDKKTSFSRYIFDELVAHYRKLGHTVDVLDLYDRASEMPFYYHWDKKDSVSGNLTLDDFPLYHENRERFMAADRLLVVFPVYWYSTPGILKCWIDMITNFAYKYEGGRYAKPLHHVKKTFTVHTSFAPKWYTKYVLGNLATRQVRQTFRWFGVRSNYCYEVGSVAGISKDQGAKIRDLIIKKGSKLL